MTDREQPNLPTHRAYSVIRREDQDDYWLNVGVVFPHKDNSGFNIMLQALPLDGKIVCREIAEDEAVDETDHSASQPARRHAKRKNGRPSNRRRR
jgi:hypothetical protein